MQAQLPWRQHDHELSVPRACLSESVELHRGDFVAASEGSERKRANLLPCDVPAVCVRG